MKQGENNERQIPVLVGSDAGFAIASETSPVLDKIFRSGGVN